jgi:hypothetical protein
MTFLDVFTEIAAMTSVAIAFWRWGYYHGRRHEQIEALKAIRSMPIDVEETN